MGYLHINNLYKVQDVLLFREVYAMEKVHGTSTHIAFSRATDKFEYNPGGASQFAFEACFDRPRQDIEAAIRALNVEETIVVYAEAYGGSQQKMAHTYGKKLRFIVFDIQINGLWLHVPAMTELAAQLGFEVVPWRKVPATAEALNAERDLPSEVAIRRGILEPRPREGIVVRPPIEVQANYGRLIAKHKSDAFSETATPRAVDDPAKLAVITEAAAIAAEWVTPMRLEHVLDKCPITGMEQVKTLIDAMVADVKREAAGEITAITPAVVGAIGKATVALYKAKLSAEAGL